jgi:hypothetical protein
LGTPEGHGVGRCALADAARPARTAKINRTRPMLYQGEAVARVSKHRFALSDTYGIEVAPGEDEGLVLAVAVAVDEMAHDSDGGDH